METNLSHRPSPRAFQCRIGFAVLFLLAAMTGLAAPFGTEFRYQGRLSASGFPAVDGLYDFQFTLHDAAALGLPVGSAVTMSVVPVTNGLFAVQLNFGATAFTTGEARWLQLQVNTNGLMPLVTLNPRQQLTPVPQAIYAGSAATASSVTAGAVTSSSLAPGSVGGTAIDDGSITSADLSDSLLNDAFWKLAGNVGTTPAANFVGTADDQPLELRANSQPALRLAPDGNVVVDPASRNINGTMTPGLTFGAASGEGISSRRGPGTGQWGLDFHTGFQPRMTIASSGNVGINKNNPATTLDVNGTITATRFRWAASAEISPDQGGSLELGDSLGGGTVPFIDFHYGVGFDQDHNVRLINNADGQLTVEGGFHATGSVVVDQSGQNNGAVSSASLTFGTSSGEGIASRRIGPGGGNQYGLDFYTGFQDRMTILNNGNVGIGTTTPTRPLEVQAAGDVEIGLKSTDLDGRLWTIQSSGNGTPGREQTFQIIDRTAGASRLLINPIGNIGIGTANPATALDVNGVVTASSDVTEAFQVRGAAAGYALYDRVPSHIDNHWSMFASGGTLGFYSANAGATLMSVSPSGDVTAAGFSGNAGATLTVGTTDRHALELNVNGARALRLEPTAASDTVNVTGGSARNVVDAGVMGATIGGGGAGDLFGFAYPNRVEADFGTISGGYYNTIQANANSATIGGGLGNGILTNSAYATVSGGEANTIQTNSWYATISGGVNNKIRPNAAYAVIGGGGVNEIQDSAGFATIGGGRLNTVLTNTLYATIPGGRENCAAANAFAAGTRAKATHLGAFVWADSTGANLDSAADNSVTLRAAGGYRLFSNSGTTAGVSLAPDGTAWAVISDRNVKKDFAPVDQRTILEKLAALPITQWHYQWEPPDVTPHIGPMAQDFKAAFYPGTDDKSITTQEADGVALAAIQGLNQKVEEKDAEIRNLRARLEKLEHLLHRELDTIETK
jgi:hypothetical protein